MQSAMPRQRREERDPSEDNGKYPIPMINEQILSLKIYQTKTKKIKD
jgi:hypothetical protein